MESYLVKAMKKLRKEVPRKLKELRTTCDEVIIILTEQETIQKKSDCAWKYIDPFKLACESRQPRLMEIGLDAIHFLIEHGYLRAKSISTENGSQINYMDSLIQVVSECSDEYDEIVQLQVIKVLLTAVTSSHCEVHEGNLLLSVRSCFHIHLISRNQVNKTTAKAALTQMLSVINQRMEVYDLKLKASTIINHDSDANSPSGNENSETASDSDRTSQTENQENDVSNNSSENGQIDIQSNVTGNEKTEGQPPATGEVQEPFISVYHKDAFLTFRAICKISMKGLQDETGAQSDPIALQNKVLSLELVHHILHHSGPVFQSDDRILSVIKDYLCVSLLTNCTSQLVQVTGLSLKIFVTLLERFKDYLKSEVEVFVTGIFLRILESENSTYEHKLRVLEVFHIICRDASVLVEIFVNYDCDLEAIDLFRRILDGFSKIAKNPCLSQVRMNLDFMSATGKRGLMEEYHIRQMGLEGLVIILNSMVSSGGFHKSIRHITSSSSTDQITSDTNDSNSNIENQFEEKTKLNEVENVNVSNDAVSMVGIFDKKQKLQEEIETGILKFNLSPKKGIAYLVDLGHIEMSPQGVAKFLLQYQDRLDKATVGEYLGREREYEGGFCLKVLHEYVDNMDFQSMPFDLAIRHFLQGFRLPGEAQKIDRIMEKFAERYYLQNRDVFASADMAFILAFSTIMLQTNLHNPAIREDKRMTKEQFIKQNKGISSDGEIPDQMLMEIYDRIAAEPIRINQEEKKAKKEEPASSFAVFPISSDKKKKDAFFNERIEMVRTSEALFKQKTKKGNMFVRKATQHDEMYVRPMFEVVWAPIMGVLSQVLETAEDENIINLCLAGFQSSIHLACRLEFPVARDTFINALTKFTLLDTLREMQPKNIECIKTLIDVANAERDYIDDSWKQVLQSISQLARLQLFADGLHTDDMFFSDSKNAETQVGGKSSSSSRKQNARNSLSPQAASTSSIDPFRFFSGPSKAETVRILEETNADMIMKELSPDKIDQIFFNSQYLSEQSVYFFVKGLCEVSILEINTDSSMNTLRGKDSQSSDSYTPRIFSLQKLVEVAAFNMHSRPRIAWTNIWNLLASYFTSIGMNDNIALSMYAIDSLKQLSIKFLQKGELSNFNFQRLFLKPFETVMTKTKYIEIKDLILRCIDIMIQACASNIRSGWRVIFAILEVAAIQDNVDIASMGFEIIERLMTSQFDLLIFDFVELMNCLVAFVSGAVTQISIKSLSHLARCADNLADGRVTPALDNQHTSTDLRGISWEKSKTDVKVLNSSDESAFKLWWPLLLGLSTRVSDSRSSVRIGALKTLDEVLSKYGHIFSAQTWNVIFKGVLFPMIDSARTDFSTPSVSSFPSQNAKAAISRNSWIGTMGEPVLKLCLDMFFKFRDRDNCTVLLSDILLLLESCICQDNEVFAKMSLKALLELLSSRPNDNVLNDDTMDLVCKRMNSCLLQNFAIEFSSIGAIQIHPSCPENIKLHLIQCPLRLRRLQKEDKEHPVPLTDNKGVIGKFVCTPYGNGFVKKEFPADIDHPQIRYCIALDYGHIFTRDFQILESAIENQIEDVIPFDRISTSIMTSMVVSLESIRVTGDIMLEQLNKWKLNQVVTFLDSLEILYWHARSFNADISLRKSLHNAKFMRFTDDISRLPHLLEQEVFTLSKILDISFKLYSEKNIPDFQSFSENWVHRFCIMTFERYLNLETVLETSTNGFDNEEHEAYGAAVLIALQGINKMTIQQFEIFYPKFSNFFSKMIICDDVDVRSSLIQVFDTHMNSIMMRNI